MGIHELVISGGEPFVRSDIFDFLSFCKKSKVETTVLTSGVLLDRKKIKTLKKTGVNVRMSLEGVSKEAHDYVRGKGALETFIKVMSIIREEKLENISVHFTLNKVNLPEVLALPYFLNKLGIKDVVLSTIKPTGNARLHPELLIEPESMPFVNKRLCTISKDRSIVFSHYKEENWKGFSCPAAFAKCGITSDGRITPCVFLGAEFLGSSIREHPFQYIWQNDKILNVLRNLSSNKNCLSCQLLLHLHGGCRARALYFYNDLNAIDPYCCQMKKPH